MIMIDDREQRVWNLWDKLFDRDFWQAAFLKTPGIYIREDWKKAEKALQEEIIRFELKENPAPGYLKRLRKISRRSTRLLMHGSICNYIVTGFYTVK